LNKSTKRKAIILIIILLFGITIFLVTRIYLRKMKALSLLAEGNSYQRDGKYDNAISTYKKAISFNPKLIKAREEKAKTHLSNGNFNEAISECNQALSLKINSAPIFLIRGIAHFNKGELHNGLSDLNKAIELDPSLSQAYYNRGSIYEKMGKTDKAIEDLTKVIQISSNNIEKSVAYNARGHSFQLMGDDKKALEDYTRATEAYPKNSIALFNRAITLDKIGSRDKALKAYKLFISVAEKRRTSDILYKSFPKMGNIMKFALEQAKMRIQALEKFGNNDKEHIASNNIEKIGHQPYVNKKRKVYNLIRLANLYRKKGDFSKAIEFYDKALKIDKRVPEIYYQRGKAYNGLKHYSLALKDLSLAIELAPDISKYYEYRGGIYGKIGDAARAIKNFNKAIELNPNSYISFYNRGLIYTFLRKELQRALSDFNEVIKLNPDHLYSYLIKGRIYEVTGKKKEAVDCYKRFSNLSKKKKIMEKYKKDAFINTDDPLRQIEFIRRWNQ